MATKQKFTNEVIRYETEITDSVKTSQNPPTTEAVYNALGGATPESPEDHVFEKILMSANDTTYEVTIDENGDLAVAEVEEEGSGD